MPFGESGSLAGLLSPVTAVAEFVPDRVLVIPAMALLGSR
jgi:hypothetical protein